MQTSTEGIYCNSLVAVFEAAFQLGYDPYALAARAKLDVARFLEMSPSMLRQGPERVIDESLLVARIINERWPTQELSDPCTQNAQFITCLKTTVDECEHGR